VKSGADLTALNEQKKTPLEVAASPENPCENPDLEKVIKFLGGDYQEEEETEGSNSSPTQQQEKLAGDNKTPSRQPQRGRVQLFSTNMSNSNKEANTNNEEVTSSNQKEDVYEFKTSSKEATPTSSRGSASPGNAAENAGDKRPADDEDDSANKTKRKKDDTGGGPGGRGRGVRGNSSDKGGGKQGGRGRGVAGGGVAASTERRSPPARLADNSPAPSPGKGKQPKNEQLAA